MSSFTEFATKPGWCRYSLNSRFTYSDHGNNYVSCLDNKIMNGVYLYQCLITNLPSKLNQDCMFFLWECTHSFGTLINLINLKFM